MARSAGDGGGAEGGDSVFQGQPGAAATEAAEAIAALERSVGAVNESHKVLQDAKKSGRFVNATVLEAVEKQMEDAEKQTGEVGRLLSKAGLNVSGVEISGLRTWEGVGIGMDGLGVG